MREAGGRANAELLAHCERADLDLEDWGRGLERFGLEAQLRAAHAATKAVVALWHDRPDPGVSYRGECSPGEQVAAVAEWLDCPCDGHVQEVLATLPALPQRTFFETHGDAGWTHAHDAAEYLALSIRRPKFVPATLSLAARALAAAGRSDAERSVHRAAADALRAWAHE